MFKQGMRVSTPKGNGKVLFVRTAAPSYKQIASVSVALDSRVKDPHYTGNIFSGDDLAHLSLLDPAQ